MPKIVKQTSTGTKRRQNTQREGTVWDRIAPVSLTENFVRMAIYGRSGSGKTRFACTWSKPLLLIGTEDGTKSVLGDKGVDFVRLESSDDMGLLIESLSGSKYKSVVLDTASMLQDLVLKEILGLDEIPIQKTWGLATRDQYGQCGIKVKEYLRGLLSLSCHVVVITQERNFNEESNGDVLAPSVGPGLTPSVAGWLGPAVDYVCQTFIRQEVTKKKIKVGDKVHETEVKTDKTEFCLRTAPHETFITKFRLPRGRELPLVIVDPTFAKVQALLK